MSDQEGKFKNLYETLKSKILSGQYDSDNPLPSVRAVKKLLSRRPRPEAIICRNDHQAAHLLVTLRSIGKRVPEEVSVAGFNDVGYASILSPSLTTVHLPCEDIARQAFAFLRERIGNPGIPTRECYLSAPLVLRGSTRQVKENKQ